METTINDIMLHCMEKVSDRRISCKHFNRSLLPKKKSICLCQFTSLHQYQGNSSNVFVLLMCAKVALAKILRWICNDVQLPCAQNKGGKGHKRSEMLQTWHFTKSQAQFRSTTNFFLRHNAHYFHEQGDLEMHR